MNPSADVSSIQGIQDWHDALCVFQNEAKEVLITLNMEIQRAQDHLADLLKSWQRAARDTEDEIVQAKAELNRRKTPDFSGRIPDCSVEEERLQRAIRKKEYLEDQADTVRKWMQKLPRLINEGYETSANRFRNLIEGDVTRAVTLLERQIQSLEKYLAVQAEAAKSQQTGGTP